MKRYTQHVKLHGRTGSLDLVKIAADNIRETRNLKVVVRVGCTTFKLREEEDT